jgi:sugar lactone lactonase YvrE
VLLGLIIYQSRSRISGGLHKKYFTVVLGLLLLALHNVPSIALVGNNTNIKAYYPEGPVWIDGTLYIAEMPLDRIGIINKSKITPFWSEKGCGPTSVSRYSKNKFIVLCHRAAKLVIIDKHGRKLGERKRNNNSKRFQDPNDCHSDGNGGVFFTDAGLFRKGAKSTGTVYHIDPQGVLHKLIEHINYANGIAYDAKHQKLYVSEHLAGKVWKFTLDKNYRAIKYKLLFDIKDIWKPNEIDYAETGPDGIEILDSGSIAVAIYGKGTIIIVHPHYISRYEVDTKFVTNIAAAENEIAIVGAYQNRTPPFPGRVHIVSKQWFNQNSRK